MSERSPSTSPRFLNPAVLGRIGNLQLVAKTVVEGFVSGLHRSPYHGFSLDFAEYRDYAPGDDVRTVDWKVYGRTDRFYVKKFEGETNTQLYLLVDGSRSMHFAGHAVSKLDYARFLASCLAFFALRQKDAAGLVTFDSGIVHQIPPRTTRGHFMTLIHRLEKMEASGSTDIGGTLEQLTRIIRKRSLVVLISDFYQEPDRIGKALRFFHHRGNDVILFHLLDPFELDPPFSATSTLEDMETGERLTYVPEISKSAYQDRLRGHIEELRKECRDVYIDYEMVPTDQPLDQALHRYLGLRAKRF